MESEPLNKKEIGAFSLKTVKEYSIMVISGYFSSTIFDHFRPFQASKPPHHKVGNTHSLQEQHSHQLTLLS